MLACYFRSSLNLISLTVLCGVHVPLAATEQILSGSDFEPTRAGDHTYPMAVVLYDESNLTPFQKESREFEFNDIKVSIQQNWKDIGVAAVVWDAAVSLGEYLVQNPNFVSQKRVLELGAGTGLAGIVAANLGADITLTDRENCLSILEENVSLNGFKDKASVHVKALEWGEEPRGDLKDSFDVILGADIIYIEESFPSLLKTLSDVANCDTKVILAQKIRYERDEKFLKLLEETFTVREIEYRRDTDVHIYSALKKC